MDGVGEDARNPDHRRDAWLRKLLPPNENWRLAGTGKNEEGCVFELADAILWLYDMVHNLPPARNPSEPLTSQELKVGFRDPPSMKVINSPFTFEGEGYMGQDHSIAYQLPERQVLKRMYLELHKFSPGNSISVGEFKIPLIQISKEFKGTRVIRRSFKKYAGSELRDLEKIVDYFARQEIKPEEVLRLMFRESNDARK